MIPAYIISLADEQARRAHMRQECARVGVDAVFVDAADLRRIDDDELRRRSDLPAAKPKKKQRRLTRGEVGCALSHHGIYAEIVRQGQPYALILEDDAEFIRNPAALLDAGSLNAIAKQYPFDVLLLGYVKTLPAQLPYYYRRIPIKTRAELTINGETVRFGTPWEQYGCGTVAYVITLAGAEKLLPATATPCVAADDWLYFERQHGLSVLHSRPAFVLEALEKFDSTIRTEKAGFLKPKTSSIIIRSIKGRLKHMAMNYLGMK